MPGIEIQLSTEIKSVWDDVGFSCNKRAVSPKSGIILLDLETLVTYM